MNRKNHSCFDDLHEFIKETHTHTQMNNKPTSFVSQSEPVLTKHIINQYYHEKNGLYIMTILLNGTPLHIRDHHIVMPPIVSHSAWNVQMSTCTNW